MKKTTRRDIIACGIKLVAVAPLLPVAGRVHAAEPACVMVDSEPLRESLSYMDPSPDPARPCRDCGFFKPEGNAGCGYCDIMTGPVNGTANCESWSERSG